MINREQYELITSGGGGGDATAANQTTQISEAQTSNTKLTSIDTKLTSQATAANQTTANSSLSSIDTKLTSQATAANQTTANSSLSSIDTKLTTENTNSGNTATYLSTIRTPVILSTSTTGTIAPQIHNVSFYNSGSAAGTITIGANTVSIAAGITVNFNAGGNNNRYAINTFSYNATGTTFIIAYTQ